MTQNVDDILHIIKEYERTNDGISLYQIQDVVDNLCSDNTKLKDDVTKILQYPSGFFDLIALDSKSLLQAMYRTNTILGGVQATAFLFFSDYVSTAPWDFYCSLIDGDPEEFIGAFESLTVFRRLHYKYDDIGSSVVYYQSDIDTINARIFVGPKRSMESILDLQYSYEQSAVSAVAAISFWPKLNKADQYLIFRSNPGHSSYPHSDIKYDYTIDNMRKVKRRRQFTQPSIYSVEDDKTYIVVFDNKLCISERLYTKAVNSIRGLLYSVFNSSTKYLGTVGNMK